MLLAPSPLMAQPAGATVHVRGPGNQAVPSKIRIRRNGVEQTPAVETDANGERSLANVPCDLTVEFRVKPNSNIFSGSGAWQACNATPMVLAVRKSQVVAVAFDDLMRISPSAVLVQRSNDLTAALASGDSATASRRAYDLAVQLRRQGLEDQARSMTAIVVDQGTAALAEKGLAAPEQAVMYDVDQKAFVATPAALDALATFQEQAGIRAPDSTARPQWNWRTVQALNSSASISANEP